MTASLAGKTVLVVGGTSGMGYALAEKAAAAGANVHIVGRSVARLTEAKYSITGNVTIHAVDLRNESEVVALARTVARVDHLVTTAADNIFKPFVELSNEDIEAMLTTKLWGAIYLIRHFAKRISPEGSITLFGGAAALKGSPGASIVAALNASMDGLARTLALELAPIRVNTLSPGVVDTPAWDFLPTNDRAAVLGSIGSSLPRGRVGTAEELAQAAFFLMTNGFTTGTVLQVDGGANA
ncbi:NAD(P)-dependent dehydrogenase (short-subunit alcohol dehydrogenase family) [Luteibacter sp. Sphag1AF]|uniref:SDR family oxidoreductase n=1 Tax=Luteibacter sp. Sphag1AF TaxID=2587031 RepID=UPI00160C7DBB|nr:SDR family oxidoreductase [Luteibacter sp. Sphag1AF]MBB3228224.1 NAD(P)-dependent dehydrogenase (short-subunit alcohol dehydrogenase family) [Luteibacter sp. Sphag1AF]